MSYQIAIPSYKRPVGLKEKTLNSLDRCGIKKSDITIFLADEQELSDYKKELGKEYKLVVGKKGLSNQRNFISNYFEEKEPIVFIDDDIEAFLIKSGDKLVNLEKLDFFCKTAFDFTKSVGAELWGVYPVKNAFFMKDQITTDLKYIIGAFYGIFNRKSLVSTIDQNEDYERTILSFINCKKVVRFNKITIKTKYWKNDGGLQEFRKDNDYFNTSAQYMVDKYGFYCEIDLNKSRKKKHLEIKLKRKNA